jgi:hypothetical protein
VLDFLITVIAGSGQFVDAFQADDDGERWLSESGFGADGFTV